MPRHERAMPSLVARVIGCQVRKAERVAAQYDRCNGLGGILKARARVFETMEINGFAEEGADGTSYFGLSSGLYLWALQVSCLVDDAYGDRAGSLRDMVHEAVHLGGYSTDLARAGTGMCSLMLELATSVRRKSTIAMFSELTWAVWNHEIAHVIGGHTKIVSEDGIWRRLREVGGIETVHDLLSISDCKIIEGEADCRAASLRTAEIIDRFVVRNRSMEELTGDLSDFLLCSVLIFSLLFAARGDAHVQGKDYPSPFARLTYAWSSVGATLDVNGIDRRAADVAMESALGRFGQWVAFIPAASSILALMDEGLQRDLKEELWDLGSQSIARREHFARYVFYSSTVEVMTNPFD